MKVINIIFYKVSWLCMMTGSTERFLKSAAISSEPELKLTDIIYNNKWKLL